MNMWRVKNWMMNGTDILNIVWGDSAMLYNYPNKANIFLFDPPFFPRKKSYKQIRNNTLHKMKEIEMPDNWKEWFECICWVADKILSKDGWFIFKADSITFLESYPILSKYFYFYREVVWDKGIIGLGNMVRMRHELLIMCYRYNEKPYWDKRQSENKYIELNDLDGNQTSIKKEEWHGNSKNLAFPSVLNIKKSTNGELGKKKKDTHINETPTELWDNFLEFCVPSDGVIVDSCMGSASILKSMRKMNEKLDRNMQYWGIELDKTYKKELDNYLNNGIEKYMEE